MEKREKHKEDENLVRQEDRGGSFKMQEKGRRNGLRFELWRIKMMEKG